MRSPHAPRLQVHGHDSRIAGPEEGAVHVQVRYKDGPPDLVYGEILMEGAGPPGVRGDRDEAVKLVVPGVPGYQLRGKLAATHVHNPDHAPTVGLHPDHSRDAHPLLVGRGAPLFVWEWLRAAVLQHLDHVVRRRLAVG